MLLSIVQGYVVSAQLCSVTDYVLVLIYLTSVIQLDLFISGIIESATKMILSPDSSSIHTLPETSTTLVEFGDMPSSNQREPALNLGTYNHNLITLSVYLTCS